MNPESQYQQPPDEPQPPHAHLGYTAITENEPLPSTPEPVRPTLSQPTFSDQPIAVVKVFSVRGVEYGMMTIALIISAVTLAWLILGLLYGNSGFDAVVVPTSALIISVPVFGLLFLRLKKAELANSSLRLDSSKRRWSQLVQFLAFITCLVNLMVFVYTILQHLSGNKGIGIGRALVDLLVVLVIAGGILTYYWLDEHRAQRV